MADWLTEIGIPLSALIYAGLFLKALGFMVRDELALRALVVSGMSLGALFYAIRPDPVWDSFIADSVLIAINLALIVVIVLERSTLAMTSGQKRLYTALGNLNPGQFRRLARRAKWEEARADLILISEGAAVDRLYFLDTAQVIITKGGQTRAVPGPMFAGEIVLLRGGVASATVQVTRGTVMVSWSIAELHQMMARSQPLKNALIARFSLDLAHKLARSVPVDQVEAAQ